MTVPFPLGALVQPLSKDHDRATFSCGVASLDRYLRQQAGQDMRKHVAVTFVLVEHGSAKIIGFYTLSATTISLRALPETFAGKLPRYPLVPAILLARLAVDRTRQGQGYGEFLLIDALGRCLNTQDIGWTAVVVDAKDESAALFYQRFHFIRFAPDSPRLFLPQATIAALLSAE